MKADEIVKALQEGKRFQNSTKSFRLRYGSSLEGLGLLPYRLVEAILNDEPSAVFYSYGTPIAWTRGDGGAWVVPAVRYSVTTSKHQNTMRQALSLVSPEPLVRLDERGIPLLEED